MKRNSFFPHKISHRLNFDIQSATFFSRLEQLSYHQLSTTILPSISYTMGSTILDTSMTCDGFAVAIALFFTYLIWLHANIYSSSRIYFFTPELPTSRPP
jgi:hypothetical protein